MRLPAIVSLLVLQFWAVVGVANPLDAALKEAFVTEELPGLHSAMAELGDERLAEVYFEGKDEVWGRAVGMRAHGPDTLHDLRSVTKSIVGLLYGIALAEELVPPPEASIYAQFPEYPDLFDDKERASITIGHALSMQMGLEWNENLPYSDPRNSEIAMERADDRIRFVLEQPIRETPGKSWIYSGGAVALIAELIARGAAVPLDTFAKERMFDPLGIVKFEWISGRDGVPSAASGLRLTLPDLVKIGHLVARNGMMDGKQIIPAGWLKELQQPRATVNQHSTYGYLWYLIGSPDNIALVAVGNGGQRLTLQPKHDLVTASFAGRYNDPNAWQTSFSVLIDHVVPEVRERLGK